MTIEEKAKAYDYALKVIEKYKDVNVLLFTQDLKEEIFPELKESEDERARKWIIRRIMDIDRVHTRIEITSMIEPALAWLEKQKPTEWGDEDEEILTGIINYLSCHACDLEGFDKWHDWLKSLKQKIKKG